ncbi:hypothetical protein AB4Z22_20025, partial [Paenibacillus sp. TAF58]
MADIMLRPDLKTAGGEVCDIMYNGKFVGTLTLVYRESDRLKGSIQLEQQSIAIMDKQKVYEFVQSYIQNVIDALAIEECEVLVSYSDYDFVIATDHASEVTMLEGESHAYAPYEHDDEVDYEWVRDETRFDDIDSENASDKMDMIQGRKNHQGYELVIVGESRNRVDYHVYDNESELVAEITLHMYGTDVIGDITWRFDPFDEEMDRVSELIVEDFDEDETDSFIFNMFYN